MLRTPYTHHTLLQEEGMAKDKVALFNVLRQEVCEATL